MGDKSESAEQVIRRYADTVYRLAYARTGSKADADDVFQEVFLRYIRRKPELDDDEHLKAWFIRVTVNCCKSLALSYWNKHTEGLSDNLIFDSTGEYDLYYELQRLRPKEREVIHLYYYEGYQTPEIAAITGEAEGTVRSRLSRARAKLREILKGDLP